MSAPKQSPTSRWSAIRLLDWYETASIEDVWSVVDPHLYKHPCRTVARILGCSIDCIHSYRKDIFRKKSKPTLENFIRLLSI